MTPENNEATTPLPNPKTATTTAVAAKTEGALTIPPKPKKPKTPDQPYMILKAPHGDEKTPWAVYLGKKGEGCWCGLFKTALEAQKMWGGIPTNAKDLGLKELKKPAAKKKKKAKKKAKASAKPKTAKPATTENPTQS